MEETHTLRVSRMAAGLALILGTVLMVVAVLLHPSEFDPALRSHPHYVAIHLCMVTGQVLALPGLLLLVGRLLAGATFADILAALLVTLGWTQFTTQIVVEGLVVPGIERQYGIGPIDVLAGPASSFYLLGAAGVAIGFPLLAWRLPRIGAPRWAARLLFLAPLPVFWPPLPDWLGKGAFVVFAAGIYALGSWLVRSAER